MHQLKATVPNPRLSGDGGDMSGSADYVFRVQRWAMKGFMDFLAWRSCTTSRVALVFRRWFYFFVVWGVRIRARRESVHPAFGVKVKTRIGAIGRCVKTKIGAPGSGIGRGSVQLAAGFGRTSLMTALAPHPKATRQIPPPPDLHTKVWRSPTPTTWCCAAGCSADLQAGASRARRPRAPRPAPGTHTHTVFSAEALVNSEKLGDHPIKLELAVSSTGLRQDLQI